MVIRTAWVGGGGGPELEGAAVLDDVTFVEDDGALLLPAPVVDEEDATAPEAEDASEDAAPELVDDGAPSDDEDCDAEDAGAADEEDGGLLLEVAAVPEDDEA